MNNEQLCGVLQHLIAFLMKQKKDWQFNQVLSEKVMPLLSFHPLVIDWKKEREEYFCRRKSLEKVALVDLKEGFESLKERLIEADFIVHNSIKQRVCIIESIFMFRREKWIDETDINCSDCGAKKEEHRVYVLPSYIYGVYEQINRLCMEIMNLGRTDLLDGYVEIKHARTYVHDSTIFQRFYCVNCGYVYGSASAVRDFRGDRLSFYDLGPEWLCPDCGADKSDFLPIDSDMVVRMVPYIESFTFASRYFELSELDKTFELWLDDLSKAPTWFAYEILSNVRWASEVKRDFLRKKKLHNDDQEACDRSKQLLELDDLKKMINLIGQKKQGKNPTFYKGDQLIKALNVVNKEMKVSFLSTEDRIQSFPLSIELIIEDDIHLRLRVEWLKGVFEVCELHLFQDGHSIKRPIKKENKSFSHFFIENLIDNPGIVSELEPSKLSGANSTKYLRRVGICKVLEKIFIIEKTAHGACLSSTVIDLSGKSELTLRKLMNKVHKLRTFKWESTIRI